MLYGYPNHCCAMVKENSLSVEFIYCHCNCGKTRSKYDKRGRECRYIYGHFFKVTIFPDKKIYRGEEHPQWKGGKSLHHTGYIIIYKPDHPFAWPSGHVPQHRLVMEKHLERYLTTGEVVHHINGNKKDNRIENLQLMTKSEHIIYHKSGTTRTKKPFNNRYIFYWRTRWNWLFFGRSLGKNQFSKFM